MAKGSVFTLHVVQDLLRDQDGVISRSQLEEAGAEDHAIRRLVRRRELVVVHPGVLINHTGELTWQQRAWAAVLAVAPAALSGQSALRIENGPGWRGCRDSDPIEVAVAVTRRVHAPAGVRLRRVAHFEERARLDRHPPRMRVEEATLDAAIAAHDDFARIEVLAAAVRARLTTAERLRAAINARSRLPSRRWLLAVLRDIGEGTCSVLEHGYLTLVERAHLLPTGTRQGRDSDSRGTLYRHVAYVEFEALVELDGRIDHEHVAARDADLDRDVDAAVRGLLTARLGWGQVFGRPCATAGKVARLLQSRGWVGAPSPCGSGCVAPVHFAA